MFRFLLLVKVALHLKALKKHMSTWQVSSLMITFSMTSVQFLVGRYSQQQKNPNQLNKKNPNPTILNNHGFSWQAEAHRHFRDPHTLGVIWKYLFRDLLGPCLSMEKKYSGNCCVISHFKSTRLNITCSQLNSHWNSHLYFAQFKKNYFMCNFM